jgi:hypothetical protein
MNFMKLNTFCKVLITGILFAITGCGGGGGGTTATTGGTTATTVSGVVSKGLVNGSTVKIFSVDANGNRSTTPLAAVTTTNGAYSCTIDYSGMVVVEASGGTYTDEATNTPATTLAIPLRAAFNIPSGATSATSAVTPLTELAIRNLEKDSKKLLKTDVENANKLVSSLFLGGTDIITTMPVDIANPGQQATDTQKNYTLLLAAISEKQKSDSTGLDAVLTTLSAAPLSLATNLEKAKTDFPAIASNPVKLATKAAVTVSIPTLPAGKQVAGVSFTIQLPAGISPAVLDPNNPVDASKSISLIGGATGSLGGASYDSTANTIKFGNITTSSFGSGDFLVINCSLVSPSANANPSGFTLLNSSVIDINGASIGVTPTISVTFS